MLKRYFIFILLGLALLAVAVYLMTGSTRPTRDVRDLVPVEQFRLSNGLTVVVMPSTRIPVVTHMLIVKAGGADDPSGKSGLAHYLEHLMFTGTSTYAEGVYDRTIARLGGAQNAFTTRDYTLYYATVGAEHLAQVMAMEADRLTNLVISDAHAARELKVISEERATRVDNSAAAQLSEQLNALTFLNHPYHQPIIGWAEDMATFTAADARAFFEKHYRASNMILLVAGDVTTRDVRRLAQRYYGALPAGVAAARNWPDEPPARLTRRGELADARVNEPRLIRHYMAPSVVAGATAQALPLAVVAQYMGGGDSSALYQTLVREQKLATSVQVSYDPLSIGPALLRIDAIPAPGISLEELETALDRTLANLLAQPLDAAAITRAKTLLVADITFAQDGLESLANVMAGLYAIGRDEQFFYGWSEAVEAVTPEAAREAARSVLVKKGHVTGYLKPEAPQVEATDAL